MTVSNKGHHAIATEAGVTTWALYRTGDVARSLVDQENTWTRAQGAVTGYRSSDAPAPKSQLTGPALAVETSRYYGTRTLDTAPATEQGKVTRRPSLETARKRVASRLARCESTFRCTKGDLVTSRELIESYADILPVDEYDAAVDALDLLEMEYESYRTDVKGCSATDVEWFDSYGVRITDDWAVNLRSARTA